MTEQTQKYTTPLLESSRPGEISRAVVLVREASKLLKSKATRLPDSSPGTRLQKIATGLGDFSDSLERAGTAIESAQHRKSSKQHFRGDLNFVSQLESRITDSLRRLPIGSQPARQLFALRANARAILQERAVASRAEGMDRFGSDRATTNRVCLQSGGAA